MKLQLELTSCQVETTTDVVGGTRELARPAAQVAPHRGGGRRGRRCPAVGRRTAAHGAARVPDHRHPALPRDRRQVRHDRARAGHLRRPCACRGAEPRSRNPGQQPAAAVAAAAARADRELGDLPQHRHRLRQLAQCAVGAVAQRRTAAAVRLRRRIRRRRRRCCIARARCSTTGWSIGMSARRRTFRPSKCRVADVPATVAETVLLAALIRAAVMTALDDERRGQPLPPLSPHALRAAYWKSARDGLDGDALDLTEGHECAPARMLLGRMVDARSARARSGRRLRPGDERTGPHRRAGQRCDAATTGVAASPRRRRRDRRGRRGHARRDLGQWQRGERLRGSAVVNRRGVRR